MGESKNDHFATMSKWIVALRYPLLLLLAAAVYMAGYAVHEALPPVKDSRTAPPASR